MNITVEVKEAIAAFREYSVKANSELEKAVNNAGLLVEGTSKRLFKGRNDASVYGEPPRVDTGRLRASITHRLKKENQVLISEVGTSVEYASDVEFGTSGTMPHPFLTPSLEQNRTQIEKMISEAIKDAGQ